MCDSIHTYQGYNKSNWDEEVGNNSSLNGSTDAEGYWECSSVSKHQREEEDEEFVCFHLETWGISDIMLHILDQNDDLWYALYLVIQWKVVYTV